jgi:hypothetical protein
MEVLLLLFTHRLSQFCFLKCEDSIGLQYESMDGILTLMKMNFIVTCIILKQVTGMLALREMVLKCSSPWGVR